MTMATPVETSLGLSLISVSPFNARRQPTVSELAELTESIRQHGVLQPILVRRLGSRRDAYEIIAGERRYRAALAAGLKKIPARVVEATDAEASELQIVENLQREDLGPIEEAQSYQHLAALGDHSIEQIATKVGRSRSYVAARLGLLDLPPVVRDHVAAGRLSPSVAALLHQVPEQSLDEVIEEILGAAAMDDPQPHDDPPMTVRQVQALIRREYLTRLDRAPWDLNDHDLVPAAGSCFACPKRTGVERDLWGENRDGQDNCLDRSCWASKVAAHSAALRDQAERDGIEVVMGPDADPGNTGLHKRGKYVSLSATGWLPGGAKCYEKALGKAGLKAVGKVLLIDEYGTATPAVNRKKAEKYLSEKADARQKTKPSAGDQKAAASAAARNLDRQVRDAAALKVRELVSAEALNLPFQPTDLWHAIANVLCDQVADFHSEDEVNAALGRFLADEQIVAHHPDSVAKLSADQARAVSMELLYLLEAGSPWAGVNSHHVVDLYGLDVEDITAGVRGQLVAEAEAKEAAAAAEAAAKAEEPAPATKPKKAALRKGKS